MGPETIAIRLEPYVLAGKFPRLARRLTTPGQMKVWRVLVANGSTDKQIAESLGISPKTVAVHITRLKRNTGMRTRGELIALGWRRNILGMEEEDARELQNLHAIIEGVREKLAQIERKRV